MSKMPRNTINIFVAFILSSVLFLLVKFPAYSQSEADLEKEIGQKAQEIQEKTSVLGSIEKKIAEIKGSNNSLSQKIALITGEVNKLQESIDGKELQIADKLEEIERKQQEVQSKKESIDKILGELYIESRNRIYKFFLSSWNWDELVQNFYIRKSAVSNLKIEIEKINGEFSSLADAKANLDKEKESLDSQKKELDDSMTILNQEKAKLQAQLNQQNAQKSSVSAQIGGIKKELSQLQNYLMQVRSGGTVVSADSLVSTSSAGSYANFLASAPAGTFGVFSYGAFTHRNGMSQWGAKARADAGQSMSQILNAYYPGMRISNGVVNSNGVNQPVMSSIDIQGYGTYSFEDYYLLGIKEVPESWNLEVLKAQAIAARTYAVWYVNNGNGRPIRNGIVRSICTTQSCQVFSTPLKSGAWKTAVEQTRGQILVNADNVAQMTEYAAVHGGWGNNVKWDTTDGTGNGDWVSRSWDNKSGVTWFYRNWFDYNSKTGSYTPCRTHPNPWLTEEEMADLINTYKYWTSTSSAQGDDRVISVDFAQCWNRQANPYSMAEMRSLVSNPVTSVSGVYVNNSNGSTTGITFATNVGMISIDPTSFKKVFSLRAPGHYSIPQLTFVHINIVKK